MSENQNPRLRRDDRAEGWGRSLDALAESRRVLVGAREGVQAMQDELARASRLLEGVDWAQRGGQWPPAEDRRALLHAFADQCETAAAAGEDIGERLASAQRFCTAGRKEAEAIDPRTEQDQEDQARLRHVATGLHRSLEEARVDLERTQAALLRSAAAARESAPSSGAVETVHTDLLNRTLRAASMEGHRVDEVVSRVSSQTSTVLGAIDPVGQAARERMRAHRDLPGGGAGPPAPGVDR